MASKKDYTDVLLEDINGKFDAIIEIVSTMKDQVKRIPAISERLEKIESDMVTVRIATSATSRDVELIKIRTEKLKDLSEDLTDLQKRVKTLETV